MGSSVNGLAFCAGSGGLELALHLVLREQYRCICVVERQAYPAACLVDWMEKTPLGAPPVWDDITTFDPLRWAGLVDVVSLGLPCQPYSCAGRKLGAADPRHLWPHARRHLRVLNPTWVWGENVKRFLTSGFEHVKSELESDGYRVVAGIFSAEEVGAPHLRERLFFLGERAELADASRCPVQTGSERAGRPQGADPGGCGSGTELCNAHGPRLQGQGAGRPVGDGSYPWPWPAGRGCPQFPWEAPRLTEPGLGGAVDGVGVRAERIYMLGEGVVPVSAALAFVALWKKLREGNAV